MRFVAIFHTFNADIFCFFPLTRFWTLSAELDEITYYSQRISNRLATVEVSVRTVRDTAQEEALHQVNVFIDSLITVDDRVQARHRCQTFLNACDNDLGGNDSGQVDKKFENAILGCSLDDQKVVKKRLRALMSYLNKQTILD